MSNSSAIEPRISVRTLFAGGAASLLRSALVRNSFSYFGSKLVPGFVGLVSVPAFIRLIGLDQYGRLAVALPVLMAAASAGSGWLSQGILRFHPAHNSGSEQDSSFRRAVTEGTLATVLGTSLILGLVLLGMGRPVFTSLASLAFCTSLAVYTIALAQAQAQLLPQVVMRREMLRSIAGFAIPVALVLITGRKEFELILFGQALAYLIALPASSRSAGPLRTLETFAPGQSHAHTSPGAAIRQLWRFGWPVGLWLLLSQALPVIDRWTIQRFSTYSSAGIYASLYEVAVRSFSFLVFPLTQAAHPRIMQAWNLGQRDQSYRILRYSVLAQLMIVVGVLSCALVAARSITKFVLGFDDPLAARMLPILLLGGFLWQLALLLHKPLEIEQRTASMLSAMSAVIVLNIAACIVFIPKYGYPAASYILALSACAYIALTLCMTRFGALRGFSPATETQ